MNLKEALKAIILTDQPTSSIAKSLYEFCADEDPSILQAAPFVIRGWHEMAELAGVDQVRLWEFRQAFAQLVAENE